MTIDDPWSRQIHIKPPLRGFRIRSGNISRRAGDHVTSVELDDLSAKKILLLGQVIAATVSKQDAQHWHNAGAIGVLPRVMEGAHVLQRLGHRSGCPLLLDDDGAHLAFVACCFMSLKAKLLEPKLALVLRQVLELLAGCCHVDLAIPSLPPFHFLPKVLQKSRDIQRQYELWRKTKHGPVEVAISDAATLLTIFEKAGTEKDNKTIIELGNATEGLRTALLRIKKKK